MLVARNQEVLHFDAVMSMRREGIHVGEYYWNSFNEFAFKHNTPLVEFYSDLERTNSTLVNFNEALNKESDSLEQALDKIIQSIESDLKLEPGATRLDMKNIYLRFRLNMGYMMLGYTWVSVLTEKIRNEIGDPAWMSIEKLVLMPYKATLLAREHKDIAAVQVNQNNQSEEKLRIEAEKLAHSYGFIHSEYLSASWTAADYFAVLKDLAPDVGGKEVLDVEKFSSYVRWLIQITQKIVYIYDEGKMSLVRANWALRLTFEKLGHDSRTVLRLTEKEFFRWIETEEIPASDVIDQRRHFAILSLNERYEHFFGEKDVIEIIKEQGIKEEVTLENITELKGTVASKGFSRGKVRVVFNQEDSNKFEDGEILVASMTTPELINAMRRAAAYITDEGGTTCHAAIIAREFHKPCIIATKIATKVLKDGDMVEVDANAGVVRILK